MELVTLGQVTLNRIGSAGRQGFVKSSSVSVIREIPEQNPACLRELVVTVAEENGEQRSSLQNMTQQPGFAQGQQTPIIEFNIQGPSIFYSDPYALGCAFPALKIGGRYFKLEEVKPDSH